MKLRLAIGLMCFLAIGLVMSACSRPLGPQESCNFVQNSDGQRLSWKTHLPVKLYIHQSVPTQAYDAIDRAVSEVNNDYGNGRTLVEIVARNVSGPLDPERDGYSMIYWFTTWDTDRPTEQARTTIYWSGNEIFEADMRIDADPTNFTYNFDSASASVGSNLVDLDSLVLHELGHVLGLAHTTATGSAMHATLNEGEMRRLLGAVDKSDLNCEY